MELSTGVLNIVKSLADLPNDSYSKLITFVFETFLINTKTGGFDLNLDIKTIESIGKAQSELKDSVAALYTLIAELAKNDIDANSVSTFLEDNGYSSDKIKIFRDNYEIKVSIIRLYLNSSSSSFPHIVDVKWRLDYRIKENNLERINEPVYLIELKVEKPNEESLSTIQFTCTIEQLQDLVYKLREATKSIERLAQVQ